MRRLLLLAAMFLPPFGAFLYFVILRDSSMANEVYAIVKVLMIMAAVIGFRLFDSSIKQLFQGTARDVVLGILVGCLITLILISAFFFLQPLLIPFQALIRTKATSLFPLAWYIPVTIIFSLMHSLFEEWYWRGFIYKELTHHLSTNTALIVSALAFTAHHVIILSQLVPGILTVVFSLGVFAAGLLWVILYRKTGNLLASWISHMFADATIFAIGYLLI